MRCIAYTRVSTDEQSNGQDAQRAAIEAWAAQHGLDVVAWHQDLGVSGAADVEDCPGLEAALAALRPGMVLVVARMDRLARDVFKHALVERLVTKAKARIVSADGTGNGDGPEAALMRAICSAFSAYERALIRMRTRQALAVRKRQGLRISGIPPFGFTFSDGRLSPVPAEQATLARALSLHASGLTAKRVAGELRQAGVTGRGGTRILGRDVARWLRRSEPSAVA